LAGAGDGTTIENGLLGAQLSRAPTQERRLTAPSVASTGCRRL